MDEKSESLEFMYDSSPRGLRKKAKQVLQIEAILHITRTNVVRKNKYNSGLLH